jgi:hypothetical protein
LLFLNPQTENSNASHTNSTSVLSSRLLSTEVIKQGTSASAEQGDERLKMEITVAEEEIKVMPFW